MKFPEHIVLITTKKCNLNCIMCNRKGMYDMLEDKNAVSMNPKLISKIAQELFPHAKVLDFSIHGEPLLYNMDNLLKLAKKYFLKTEITTNAVLLNKTVINKLLPTLSKLYVSIDGATKKTYTSIRIGADYEKVIKVIKKFNQIKKEKKSKTKLILNYLLMKRNIHELPKFIDLAKELEAHMVNASHMVVHHKELIKESLLYHKKLANQYLLEADKKCKKYGIGFSRPPLYNTKKFNWTKIFNPLLFKKNVYGIKTKVRCHYLWNWTYIDSDGGVFPCCNYGKVGNLNKNSFEEIWNGKIYTEMRKRYFTNPYNCCKTCYIIKKRAEVKL